MIDLLQRGKSEQHQVATIKIIRQARNTMKVYIGDVEAFEIASERGIEELPEEGKEILTLATGKDIEVLGHNKRGFYINTLTQ